MRNTSFFTGISNSSYDNHLNSIYTKCMQEEVPVGSFNNRNSHSASCGSTMYAAVGYSDGTTIIVANARRLYRSTNGGATFQELCTWNSESYMSQYTGPIVYISGSYYYIVYTAASGATSNSMCTYTLKSVKVNSSNGQVVSTTVLKSAIQRNTSCVVYPYDTTYGSFYSTKISPRGQVMITEGPTATQYRWIVIDIPREICSGVIQPTGMSGTNEGGASILNWSATGQWFHDNSSEWGAFFLMYYTKDYTSSPQKQIITYYKVTANQFSSGAALTITNITSSLTTIINDNYWNYNGTNIANPIIHVSSCAQKPTLNKLFIVSTHFNQQTVKAYICNKDFSGVQEIGMPSSTDLRDMLKGNHSYSKNAIGGICITPDGLYGVGLYSYGAFTCSLDSKTFFTAYCFTDTELDQYYIGEVASFMLPEKTI